MQKEQNKRKEKASGVERSAQCIILSPQATWAYSSIAKAYGSSWSGPDYTFFKKESFKSRVGIGSLVAGELKAQPLLYF